MITKIKMKTKKRIKDDVCFYVQLQKLVNSSFNHLN